MKTEKVIERKKNGGILKIQPITYEELNVGDEYVYLGKNNVVLRVDSDSLDYFKIGKVISDTDVKDRKFIVEVMGEHLKKMCWEDRQRYFRNLSYLA